MRPAPGRPRWPPAALAWTSAAVALAFAASCTPSPPGFSSPSVPYVSTPLDVGVEMLKLAGVTSNDLVYDLGSGDGRLAIAAATLFGARAVGVEIDAKLIQDSREAAARAGVADRVTFVWGDLFTVDLRPATAVLLYLLPEINLRLRPKLLAELRPGTPVVSHNFDMGEWTPDRLVRAVTTDGTYPLYLWIVPAQVQGTWAMTLTMPDGDMAASLVFEQNFQRLSGVLQTPTGPAPLVDTSLRGDAIAFSTTFGMKPGLRTVRFRGLVTGDSTAGTAEVTGGLAIDPGRWVARRLSR
jgi:SAM-dependent methyltransferase